MGNVKKSLAEKTRHKRQYDRRMNERQMQSRESKVVSSKALDASLAVTENIRPVKDKEPMAKVQLTAAHNVLANEQQHTDKSKQSYDTYLLEKVDSNTTPDSTNMCHRGGEIDQDAEQYQAKSPLLKAEFLKMNDMVEKEVFNELSNRFLQLEKHCISLEISMQQKEESFQSNKPCKNQDAYEFCEFFEINDLKAQLQAKTTLICNLKNQIKSVKEASNEAKVKHEIDVLETINIELESSVAKLLAENEKLNKENEHLKQTYKELYDSIKKTRIQMKDHNDSLIAQVNSKTVENADLKAQIQENVFANVALKNELRKLKGNSFVSQVDVNNVLSKPVTPHYLAKVREYVLSKPHHVIAPGSFRNSQEEPYGSNDMAHNHYLEEARKKTQERNRNSKPSVMHTTSLQNTTNGSKPNPRSNNQISRSLLVSKSSCGMSNGVSLIAIGQRFSPKKSSAVHEKPNTPRSCLRWKPMGRIFKIASLRPRSSMTNDVCSHQFRPRSSMTNDVCSHQFRPRLVPQPPSPTPNVPPTKNDWDSLPFPMIDEYFNPSPSVVQPILVAVVQEPIVSTDTASSTRIDQDTPSISTSETTQEEQSQNLVLKNPLPELLSQPTCIQ
ncbi:hypothetical protein Tco_0123229 [Tanacetum coccineum]